MRTTLQAVQREPMSRIALKRLRNENRLPGIIFGAGADNIMFHISRKEFERFARSGDSGIVNIAFDGGETVPVLLEDVQRDPVTREYVHVDFLRVKKNELVRTKVTIEYVGMAAGTKQGGIIQTQSTWIEVEALPDHIPSTIVADISGLEIGHSLFVENLDIPKDVSVVSAMDELLVSVVAPKVG